MFAYVLRYRAAFVWGLVCVVITGAINLTAPKVLQYAVDDLTTGVTRTKLAFYGALLLAIGLAFMTNRKTSVAAKLLVVLLLASFVVQRIPEILANPGAGFVWTNPAKVLALAGGALLLAGGARMIVVTALTLGIFLLICGAQTFLLTRWFARGKQAPVTKQEPVPMRFHLQTARASIVEMGAEFYVYAGEKLVRVCPSIGMAREVAAGC